MSYEKQDGESEAVEIILFLYTLLPDGITVLQSHQQRKATTCRMLEREGEKHTVNVMQLPHLTLSVQKRVPIRGF